MSKPKSVLVLGGARSGKSTHALSLAAPFAAKTLIATLEGKDDEMRARIERHRKERGPGWTVIEEPIALARALDLAQAQADAVVVDCVTLWLNNLLMAGKTDPKIEAAIEEVCGLVARPRCRIIMVSNEVGLGIVPGDPLSRRFRDLQGKANQALGRSAAEVFFLTAGIPLQLKKET